MEILFWEENSVDKKVTIIMSAYNHEDYIESAIRSVLNQTYKNY